MKQISSGKNRRKNSKHREIFAAISTFHPHCTPSLLHYNQENRQYTLYQMCDHSIIVLRQQNDKDWQRKSRFKFQISFEWYSAAKSLLFVIFQRISSTDKLIANDQCSNEG